MRFVVFLSVCVAATFATPLPDRIVGGFDTTIEDVPYQISLLRLGSHSCGGSIINENWIVTAAHCTTSGPSTYSVRVGSTIRNSGGVVHAVAEVVNHENYGSPSTYSHDISLLRLTHPIEFGPGVQPIEMAAQGEDVPAGNMARISGWGTTRFWGSAANILQEAQVPKVALEECRASYGESSVTEDMLCAGFPEGGVDACQGDSGGPLVVNNKLHGVVSWGIGCAFAGYPGVYARVASVSDWIAAKISQ